MGLQRVRHDLGTEQQQQNVNNNSHFIGLLWKSNEAKNEEYLKCFFVVVSSRLLWFFICYQAFITYLEFLSDHQTVILIWISHRHLKYRIFKILLSPDTTSTTCSPTLSPTNWLSISFLSVNALPNATLSSNTPKGWLAIPVSLGLREFPRHRTFSFKTSRIPLPYDPSILLLGIYPEITIIWKDTCTLSFIAALFKTAKTWEPSKCPLTEEWIKKMRYVYTMEYYSAIKQNELMPFAEIWMDLKIITLSDIR